MSFCIRLQNSAAMGQQRHCFDAISIFQDGGHRVGNLLPSSGLVTAFVQNGENLFAYQISMRYLNPLLR